MATPNLLLLLHVPVTVLGIFAGELFRVRLNRVRIVYLHHFAKVHALNQLIDLVVIKVVREDEQDL